MNFQQILALLERGIKDNIVQVGPFNFAHNGGNYLGSPGKEIYFVLPNLNNDEFDDLAKRVSFLFPSKSPSNHLKWAAFVRYIYGCFEKQGCLRSEKDKKRMISENMDWSLSIKFMNRVAEFFENNQNYYGLIIHYEMLAHRYGDRAIIENDKKHLDIMYNYYMKSYDLARQKKCWKQMFTPFYWAGKYFSEAKEIQQASDCYKKCLKLMERYCPDARPGYREKVTDMLNFLKKNMEKDEKNKFKIWYSKCKNKCLKKVAKYARNL